MKKECCVIDLLFYCFLGLCGAALVAEVVHKLSHILGILSRYWLVFIYVIGTYVGVVFACLIINDLFRYFILKNKK